MGTEEMVSGQVDGMGSRMTKRAELTRFVPDWGEARRGRGMKGLCGSGRFGATANGRGLRVWGYRLYKEVN